RAPDRTAAGSEQISRRMVAMLGSRSATWRIVSTYSSLVTLLLYLRSGRQLAIWDEHGEPAVGLAGQDHALRLDPSQLAGLQVGPDAHPLADQIGRGVVLRDAGHHRPPLAADGHRQLEELVGLRHGLRSHHLGHAEIDAGEVVDGDGRRSRLSLPRPC